MLTNLLCKGAVSAVLLNITTDREWSCLKEADLCPSLSSATVTSAAETKLKNSKIIETLNCKFLEYHNQSFNLHFMFFVVKIVFQMTILHYFVTSFLSIETLVAKSLQYTGQLGTVICDNLIFCICKRLCLLV